MELHFESVFECESCGVRGAVTKRLMLLVALEPFPGGAPLRLIQCTVSNSLPYTKQLKYSNIA
jgi:hypothetical protein